MELEVSIEGQCIKLAENGGWFTRKVAWRGRRSAPDDVFIKPNRTVWIEFKKPGTGKRSELQKREHVRMKAAGAEIWVQVDSVNQFRDILGKTVLSSTQLEESVHIRKDGSSFPVEVHSRAEVYGDETGLIVVVRDITERKRVEEALLNSELMLQKSQIIGGIGSFEMDLKTGDVKGSDHLFNVFGIERTKEPLTNEQVVELIHPDDREHAIKVSSEAVMNKEGYELEHRVIYPNGDIHHLLVIGNVVCSDKNEVVKIAGTVQDITERKKAEEEFEDIFNLSPDMVGVFTTDGELLKVNPSWKKVLGYTTEELFEIGWTNLVHPDDVETTNKEVERQLSGSSVTYFINRYKHNNGTYRAIE